MPLEMISRRGNDLWMPTLPAKRGSVFTLHLILDSTPYCRFIRGNDALSILPKGMFAGLGQLEYL